MCCMLTPADVRTFWRCWRFPKPADKARCATELYAPSSVLADRPRREPAGHTIEHQARPLRDLSFRLTAELPNVDRGSRRGGAARNAKLTEPQVEVAFDQVTKAKREQMVDVISRAKRDQIPPDAVSSRTWLALARKELTVLEVLLK
jgi:hypothetical protein